MNNNITDIIEKLSPIERKIIPFLNQNIEAIKEKSGLDETSVLRALRFLESKNVLELKVEHINIIELGTNGIYYKKNFLPERRLLMLLEQNNHLSLQEAASLSKLTDNEFKVSLGILKNKALISLNNGKISLQAQKSELSKRSLEEQLIHDIPLQVEKLTDEQRHALEQLKKRKDILEIQQKSIPSFTLTEIGKKIAGQKIDVDLIEEVTPEIISSWNRSKKFRKYDVNAPVPRIWAGKRHFVNQSIEYAKRIWLDLGFKEMSGSLVQSSFWNFDSLFTAQDHPVRELQDTFYIKDVKAKLPDKSIVQRIKKAHESGVQESKGWNYVWNEEEAKRVVLRTHTTALSASTLSSLSNLKNKQGKFFAIGKCFRNETADWSHGFEFNQTEGIVICKDANFRHLLAYLKEFYKKMGFDKIKFVPAYFPYTEPSVEIYAFHPERKIWIELGGAGIFRPEVVIPLLGEWKSVLAWGPGLDRMLMDYYQIKDLRELYENDITKLRNTKSHIK